MASYDLPVSNSSNFLDAQIASHRGNSRRHDGIDGRWGMSFTPCGHVEAWVTQLIDTNYEFVSLNFATQLDVSDRTWVTIEEIWFHYEIAC